MELVLEELKSKFGFREPDRGLDKDVEGVNWRCGLMPNYTEANISFLKGKSQNHKAGKDVWQTGFQPSL